MNTKPSTAQAAKPTTLQPQTLTAPSCPWTPRIISGVALRPKPVGAVTFVRRRTSASQPVDLIGDDGHPYVVKGLLKASAHGRMLFNDHLIARLGGLLGAPVPAVELIEISQALIDLNADVGAMGHLKPCVAHGSRMFPNVTDRIDGMDHIDKGDNRRRFAKLAVLSGWIKSSDRQFIYDAADPFQVYSVDHGHWFPDGPNWTTAHLQSAAPAELDQQIVSNCALKPAEIADACDNLSAITVEMIAHALAIAPDEWGVTMAERVAVAEYLESRRVALVTKHCSPQRK